MAAIVNDRDVLLQSAQQRLAAVTSASNITVTQDQVQGLGLVVLASKLVFLSSTSQVFKVATDGTTTPTSILFTPTIKNLAGKPVSWQVTGGAILTATSDTGATLAYTDTPIDNVTVTVTVTDGGTTYSDSISIQKLREGADGIVGMLSNEAQNLPADSLGNIQNYVGASGSFRVFEGITDRTANVAVVYSVLSKSDINVVASIGVNGDYSVTGGIPLGVDSVTVTFRARYKGLNIDKVFTVTKSKAGAAAQGLFLSSTSQVFQIAKSGTILPSGGITLNLTQAGVSGTPTWTVTAGTATVTGQSATGATLTYANMSTDSVTIKATSQDGVFSDYITIVKVREGNDSITAFLSNESHNLSADNAGNIGNFAGAASTLSVYIGATDTTASWTIAQAATGGITLAALSGSTVTVTGMTVDSGYVDITATRNGFTTITKRFTLTRTKAGAAALGVNLSANSQIFQIAKNGTVLPSGGIVFTATQVNITGTPVFDVTSANAVLTSVAGTSATLLYANMSADSATIRVRDASLTYSDVITVVKVREGTDAVIAFLSNEAQGIATDSAGNNANFTGASSTMSVYIGATDTSASWTITGAPSSGVTIGPVSGGVVTVTGMTVDQGYVDVTAARNGYTSITKRFNLAKLKQGAQGNAGTGTQGPRGSMTFYVPVSAATWSDTTANSAVLAPKTLNDVVTQYNNTLNWSTTKFWDGSLWQAVNAVVDGNLLVQGTVGTNALSAASVTTNKLNVGLGGMNMLQNSGPSNKSAYGWVNGYNSTGATFVSNAFLLDGYAPLGSNSVATHMTGAPNTANTVFDIHNDNFGKRYPVKAGQRYELSGYLAIHRAATTHMRVWWVNQAGSVIQEDGVSAQFTLNDPQYNTSLTNWPRSGGFVVAPAGAVTAFVGPRTTVNGGTDPYCMVSMAYFGEATPSQTVLSPWSDGGMTMVGPGSIVTPNLSSISADIGAVRAGSVYSAVLSGGAGYDRQGYQWPNDAGLGNAVGGYHLSGSGLLLGNPGSGKYFYAEGGGNIGGPYFSITNGTATFSGYGATMQNQVTAHTEYCVNDAGDYEMFGSGINTSGNNVLVIFTGYIRRYNGQDALGNVVSIKNYFNGGFYSWGSARNSIQLYWPYSQPASAVSIAYMMKNIPAGRWDFNLYVNGTAHCLVGVTTLIEMRN